MSLQDLQNNTTSFDHLTVTYDDFLQQFLSGIQPTGSLPDITAADGQTKSTLPWNADRSDDQSPFLSSNLRQNHITAAGGGRTASSPLKSLQLPRNLASAGESALFQTDNIDDSSFKSPIGELNNTSFQNLFHGFTGYLTSDQTQQFRNLSAQNFGSPVPAAAVMSQLQAGNVTAGGGGGGAPSQPRQRVRARRGQATDPHSIAERTRRERIAERMKALQQVVPNANKTDKATMLDDIIDYVKFLQLQVKVLSMSRLGVDAGGAIATKGGGGDGGQRCGGGVGRSSNGPASSSNDDTTTVTENEVVKLMKEDIGSAMQYLQGKGLCLMPISLATIISVGREGGGPSSPNMSVLSIQSANGV